MDIQMPDMDGIETTKVIRGGQIAGLENIPIIALTAHAMKGDKEIFLAAGMDGYISKPIDAAELQRELYRILHTGKNKKPPHTKHDGTQE
jgi:CheY-like chemotaxis protein